MPSPGSEPPPHTRRAGAAPPRKRDKRCEACSEVRDVLYRGRGDAGAAWRFYCRACLLRLKADNPGYSYGGTWKRKKKSGTAPGAMS